MHHLGSVRRKVSITVLTIWNSYGPIVLNHGKRYKKSNLHTPTQYFFHPIRPRSSLNVVRERCYTCFMVFGVSAQLGEVDMSPPNHGHRYIESPESLIKSFQFQDNWDIFRYTRPRHCKLWAEIHRKFSTPFFASDEVLLKCNKGGLKVELYHF